MTNNNNMKNIIHKKKTVLKNNENKSFHGLETAGHYSRCCPKVHSI
jgi:hypothetical protein